MVRRPDASVATAGSEPSIPPRLRPVAYLPQALKFSWSTPVALDALHFMLQRMRAPRMLHAQPARMKHRFFVSDRPRVFAHRGGSGLAPENTMAAFDNGLALGTDGLELDVHLSRDGVPVVHHDLTLDRTTNLRGPIDERTAAELSQADAGWHFRRGDAFPFRGRGIGVPTLAEVLARYGVPIIVELKSPSAELAEAVVAVIRAAAAIERVCVGSFALRGLRVVRKREPAIATSAARGGMLGVSASSVWLAAHGRGLCRLSSARALREYARGHARVCQSRA